MNGRPAFFEPIRQRAAKRWDQLEQDPELAGPWHQLFKQVQSPRHILSELLQNADDAGATEAEVRIEDGCFIFDHNGEDFAEEHFASLCRFGYSNKRALHTIGFRGIGFKSTFSLGDRVELSTPSLSICFDRRRFTEPLWNGDRISLNGRTRVRVPISDQHRQREVEKNLQEWLKSPVSLLFFKHIRRMQIEEKEVNWGSLGPGPISNSEWMALYEKEDEPYLLIRSEAEPFPDEALVEIQQERMLSVEEESDFPPSKIEIVLGAKGRLFVVLPTGVETKLPFACNAPFIQDPARLKIKDPETSPTNRWLLERVGWLAASSMQIWLNQSDLPVVERAPAYGLLPDVDREESSLEGVCGTIVEEAFELAIEGSPLLLTNEGDVKPASQCVLLPDQIFDVWKAEQAAAILDDKGRPSLARFVGQNDRKKLVRWRFVDEITKQKLLQIFSTKHLPKPDSWRQLLNLWAYVAPEITGYSGVPAPKSVRIVPVQGKDVLYAASEVIRLGEKKLLQSEEDWQFLAAHLIVVNQNWTRFLAEQRRVVEEQNDVSGQNQVKAALAVLEKIGLDDTSDVNKVIDKVSEEFFREKTVTLAECIQLTQIAAKLNANAGESLRYVTRDRCIRGTDKDIYFDTDGSLEPLLPESHRQTQLLHPDYHQNFSSCTREDWQKWLESGRSGLRTFIPFVQKRFAVYGRKQIEQEVQRRGTQSSLNFPYVTSHFVIDDWDFADDYWRHWQSLVGQDSRIWSKIAERIIAQKDSYWNRARAARALQVATTGSTQQITYAQLLPYWALRFRDLVCLPDTRGFHHKPGDLLRRTPETESLMDVEPFIYGLLDRETTRPLLDLLGVRSTPTGPGRLLDCLRTLSTAERPPIQEIEKWYRRLDQMIGTCSTIDSQCIFQAFQSEKLILTQDGAWATAKAVYLSSDEEDVPGASIVRPSVNDLMLWTRIGVAPRPTAELALQWLKGLPSGQALSPDDLRRVRSLLVRYPIRIWEECAHWLNLAGEWVSVNGLSYAITMQSLIPWSHLHKWVKQETADLQRLTVEITSASPFSKLSALSDHIEHRFERNPLLDRRLERKTWLTTLGAELGRLETDLPEETERIRRLAKDLAETEWQNTQGLEVTPYINGTPAGTPRSADVVWLGRVLYVDLLPKAKLAKRVPEEIGRAFNRADIKAALDYSFERSPDDVRAYLEENFQLAQIEEVASSDAEMSPDPTDSPDPDTPTDVYPRGAAQDGNSIIDISADEFAGSVADDPNQTRVDPDPISPEPATNAPNRLRPTPKPHKASIIERFALAAGFQKDGDDRFFHANGSWIGRTNGERFPWEHRSASGELVRYFWPKDHCLEREPLQLEADVWGLIDKFPATYALILSDQNDAPVELTGARLLALRESGEVVLYPATYRLVYDYEN